MFSLKLVYFSCLLFYVFLYSKAYNTTKKKINKLDKLLKYSGWKNLNDVSSIKYHNKSYNLNSQIETPITIQNGDSKIRLLTVFLGCTYAKVINNIFSIIVNWDEICKNQNEKDNNLTNECIYTKEFINIIAKLIVPIATLMKGAMDALDSLHHFPSANFKLYDKNPYMIIPLLDRIENIFGKFNDPSLSCDDRSTNSWSFEIAYTFFKRIIEQLQLATDKYCEFVPYDTNYLWTEWVEEYRGIKQGVKLKFLKFLTKKFEIYIKKEILEKYFQVGFKFDPITEETFLPTPEEQFDIELEFKAIDEEPPIPVQIQTNILDKLLKYSGWKNLNDVSSIKYNNKSYYLKSLIETSTSVQKRDSKIRLLTVFLGYTYAKVIYNISSIIVQWQQICINKNKEDTDLINGCIYTKEFINIIAKLIVPIATLMKGAIDALDLLHHLPLANFKIYDKKPYMIIPLLDRIENMFGKFNDPSLSCDDRSTNSWSFEIAYTFFKRIIEQLQLATDKYCEFVPYDTNYLWNEWVEEYRGIKQGVKLKFLKFLIKKFKIYIMKEILEKYFQLGFKFDPITEETFIPKPEELIELELEFKAIDEEPPTPVQIEIH
ncbi:uncharacterized protein LOC126907367 isoform X3 [Daktulosphaira vitifoliae]|uniref:uncharacterized protein LOC126907367 isoform X3 n=1 Tax=Daktulosphaira vitifoliae TaxID=58002 RepID=UPI0021A9EC5C|nr:uncharacterized protein LOC126907367 isoform X3 [Daktulosphaira vitifoliae]